MATAVRKFVVPTVISQLVALLLAAQAVLALTPGWFTRINPTTGYTIAYTYESLFDDNGTMIPLSQWQLDR